MHAPARIGKYTILGELGRGGFGVVYKGHDPTLPRDVAIKVMPATADAEMVARFRREAAAAGGLSHDNIVTIHEFGEQDGLLYIVMQLLEGDDLEDLLKAGKRLELHEILHIMAQVARGLDYAHQRGIVHRDVKPANIRVLPGGEVKIMDFGVARFLEGANSGYTRATDVIGTFRYMAPEQLDSSADFDQRGDLFAYGIIYYQLLTGVHPFHAPDLPQLIDRIRHYMPPPIGQYNPNVPPALEPVVFRALAKNREERYPSLRELQLDVEPVLQTVRHGRSRELSDEAQLLAGHGRTQEAFGLLRQALELDGLNMAARQLRDELRRQHKDESAATATLQQVRQTEAPADARRHCAALMDQGRFGEALEQLRSLQLRYPQDTVIPKMIAAAAAVPAPPAPAPVAPPPPAAPKGKLYALLGSVVVLAALAGTLYLTRSEPEPEPEKISPAATSKAPEPKTAPTGAPKSEPPKAAPAPGAPAAAASLQLSKTTLQFSVPAETARSEAQLVEVRGGAKPFEFSSLESAPWIVLRSGESKGPGPLHVAVDTRGMKPGGPLEGKLTVFSDQVPGSPVELRIYLTVTQ